MCVIRHDIHGRYGGVLSTAVLLLLILNPPALYATTRYYPPICKRFTFYLLAFIQIKLQFHNPISTEVFLLFWCLQKLIASSSVW